MATIELKELTKHYRQGGNLIRALDGVSMTIGEAEFVSVVGRSGSGKTTLLDLVGLLMRPTAGTVLIDGVDTATLKDSRRADLRGRRIGFIFQEYNLLSALDVLENVMLPLRYSGGGREGRERALDLLDQVGLGDRLHHRADELSGGQQQRVAIARALVMNPKVMLFDEPTSALDPELVGEVLTVLEELAREGMTMIVVTHEVGFARRAASLVTMIDEGQIVEDAPPEEFFSHPRHERTRRFLEAVL
jgi:ABC-type polar amino acid transport system ATPase subunit